MWRRIPSTRTSIDGARPWWRGRWFLPTCTFGISWWVQIGTISVHGRCLRTWRRTKMGMWLWWTARGWPHDIWQYHRFQRFLVRTGCRSFSQKESVSWNCVPELSRRSELCGRKGYGWFSRIHSTFFSDPQIMWTAYKSHPAKSYRKCPFLSGCLGSTTT